MAKTATPPKPLTKTELLANIATTTEMPKQQVAAVLDALAAEIQKSLAPVGVRSGSGLRFVQKRGRESLIWADNRGGVNSPGMPRRLRFTRCQLRLTDS